MGMTMTQKILAAHAGLDHVEAGQLIEAQLDLVLGNDITSPVAIHEMDKMTVDTVFDKDKIALVMDHFIPNKDIKYAEQCNTPVHMELLELFPLVSEVLIWQLAWLQEKHGLRYRLPLNLTSLANRKNG